MCLRESRRWYGTCSVECLTASLGTISTVGACLATLFSNAAAAQCRETSTEASITTTTLLGLWGGLLLVGGLTLRRIVWLLLSSRWAVGGLRVLLRRISLWRRRSLLVVALVGHYED